MATARPCGMLKPLAFSIACPAVWPKLSSRRSPLSRSSRETMSALIAAQRATQRSASAKKSPRIKISYSSRSRITAYLTASASPSASVSAPSVRKVSQSQMTRSGCQKVPARFLPARRLTAVLPPMEESIAASSVVGSCTQGIPRRYTDAAKPARSPVTPPPRANTVSVRVRRLAAKNSSSRPRVFIFLDRSPWRNTNKQVAQPASRRAVSSGSAYRGPTFESVTMAAFLPAPSPDSRPASFSRPWPMSTS
ncbi:MAG: hypothetical protein BWY37_02019 [Firmicutes bacterium ADurb.Bin262]|nr:MAG: hypothetical protein BWY37_02019 [Firmicutes bacterium ADurb.Bin262]